MIRRGLPGLVLLVFFLAACGGGDGDTPVFLEGPPVPEQTIAWDTTDGIRLSGRLFGDLDSRRVVVLAHMFPASGGESWRPFAEKLAREGFLAVTFDFRGYAGSTGEKEIEKIDRDVERVLEWAQSNALEEAQRTGADPSAWRIFLVGASMGGTASLIVASRQEVAGVVTLSAPDRFRDLDARGAVTQVAAPKLFLASEGDRSAADDVRFFDSQAPEPKEHLMFSGGAHGTDMLKGERGGQVAQAILEFLERVG